MNPLFTRFCTLIALFFCFGLFQWTLANNKPFPTSGSYKTHIKPSSFTAAQLNAHATAFYDLWKAQYIKSDCGDYYVWNSDNSEKTVSEAHGYGMMLTAYFAGHDANAKSIFDGLYNYFRKNASNASPNLMDWKQLTCNDATTADDNSASDGDIDIAYALLLAHVQWGSSGSINYLEEARKVINAIMQYDVNHETWTVKLGDWSTSTSPNYYYSTRTSDFIPSHFRAFAAATGNSNWNRVIDKCYELIETMQTNHAPATGLMPDFIINTNTTPTPAGASFLEGANDGDYYYNACRNPWRLGLDYLLHGETKASNALTKLNTWLGTSTSNDASQVVNGYKLDGTKIHNFNDATFVGPLTVGGMLDTSGQSWLDSLYSTLNYTSALSGDYYSDTIKLLSLLTISGNYWAPPAEMIQPAQPTTGPAHGKYVVGYYAQWAIFSRDYNVSDIHAEHLTHLMYAFYDTLFDETTGVSSIESLDDYADTEHTEDPGVTQNSDPAGNLGALKLLKENNPHLNIMISLGGWTKSHAFPALASSASGRETLAQAMVAFIKKYPFIDGFDIDWEFPVEGGIDGTETVNGVLIPPQPHTPDDHKNLVLLLKEMRETFDAAFPVQKKWVTMAGGNNVMNLLSTHVGPGTEADHGVTENIADYTDFITFFGYDFGGNWFDKTSYNAPLYPSNNPQDPLYRTAKDNLYTGSGVPQQALDDLVTLYLDHLGIPKEKLVMGIPFYGRLFDNVVHGEVETGLPGLFRDAFRYTSSACNSGMHSPQGTWDTRTCEQSGSIGFSDLSQGVAANPHHYLDPNDFSKVSATAAADGWVKYWDDTAKVPYLYNSTTNQFVSYDDPESIAIKVNYLKSKGLGGAMIWELSEDSRDDFGGTQFSNGAALLTQIGETLSDIKVDLTINFETPQNVAIDGVQVNLLDENNAVLETQTSDTNGSVVFSQIQGITSYTVQFSKLSYAFLPSEIAIDALDLTANMSFDVLGSSNTIEFSGTTTLNGTLDTTDVVLYDDAQNELKRVQSNSGDGTFSINNVIDGGNYRVTAEKAYHTFNSFSYTNQTSNVTGIALVGNVNKHTISGRIEDSSGQAISGVTLTLSGGATAQATTDSQGNYTFTNIEAGKNYILTPSKTGLNFKPVSKQFNPLDADEIADFELDEGYIYGYVKDGSTPVSGVTVQLVLNWASSTLPHVATTAATNADGKYVFNNEFTEGGATYKVSDYAAANGTGKVEYQSWTTGGLVFMPTSYDFTAGQIPTEPTRFDFNTQVSAPSITITSPSTNPTTIGVGGDVALEATIEIQPQDSSISVNSVSFEVGGNTFTPTSSGNTYTATWSPATAAFDSMHSFKVTATASNNETSTETYDFILECSGSGCPNKKPVISWVSPTSTTVNQGGGFAAIPLEITATDADGTVQSVTISVDGGIAQQMTAGANNAYTYSLTPSAYKKYTLQITATDNVGDSTSFTQEINVTNSTFVSLPSRVNVGYYHSWDNANAPFIYLRDVIGTKYNVVVYSFIETQNGDGYTPLLTVNNMAADYQTNGAFDKAKLIADIKVLQDAGIPVIVSIGGQNGHVELTTEAEKDTFVNGVVAILNEYGFDGLDIDFEGGSMNFGAGMLTDFTYASISSYPRLKNVIDAIREIHSQMGAGFHITAAPEVQYVQQGTTAFADNWGSFLPVIHQIRDILDYIHVQLYNIGATNGVIGLDGQNYYQGSSDLIVSACESLIQGFTTAGPAIQFVGLRADQVAIGLPATDTCSGAGGAAGGGFVTTTGVENAIKYLTQGTSFTGRQYTLQGGPYPNLRGAMTWSINWDRSTACGSSSYEYTNNIDSIFSNISLSIEDAEAKQVPLVYPNPTKSALLVQWDSGKRAEVSVIDVLGRNLLKVLHHFGEQPKLRLNITDLPAGVHLLRLETTDGISHTRQIIYQE